MFFIVIFYARMSVFLVYIKSMLMNIVSQYIQVMAVDLSHRLGWIDDSIVQRVQAILKQANLPTTPPENMTVDMFKSVMAVRDLYFCFIFFFNLKNKLKFYLYM